MNASFEQVRRLAGLGSQQGCVQDGLMRHRSRRSPDKCVTFDDADTEVGTDYVFANTSRCVSADRRETSSSAARLLLFHIILTFLLCLVDRREGNPYGLDAKSPPAREPAQQPFEDAESAEASQPPPLK